MELIQTYGKGGRRYLGKPVASINGRSKYFPHQDYFIFQLEDNDGRIFRLRVEPQEMSLALMSIPGPTLWDKLQTQGIVWANMTMQLLRR